MDTNDYDRYVLRTESVKFEDIRGRMKRDLLEEMIQELAKITEASQKIDAIKKHLFYGKVLKNEASGEVVPGLTKDSDIRLLHGLLGLLTEASEMIDGLKITLDDEIKITPDLVNITEEVGDVLWYGSILCDASRSSTGEAMRKNVAKLEKRYGHEFSETKAIDRDVDAERIILET